MKRARYVVNADDFGLDDDVNEAIVRAFAEGLVSSATLMANMPGFEAACALARERGLVGKVGVHLNLADGTPLTAAIRAEPRFSRDGEFAFSLPRSALTLTPSERSAVRGELQAQIQRCLDHGVRPSHLDSHYHVHTVWPLLSIVMELAREHGIRFVRISRNVGPSPGLLKSVYKVMMNGRLHAANLAGSRWFGSAEDVAPVHRRLAGRIEIMVHPKLANGEVIDLSGVPLREVVGALGVAGDMCSYSDLR